MRRLSAAFLLLAGAACAQSVRPPELSPAELAGLEARRARHQKDPDELTAIGIAFYQAGAYDRSREVLLAALALRPQSFAAAVQLGLAAEALGRYDEAFAAYRRAQAVKVSRADRRNVEERMAALTRTRLAADARQAIASEPALATTPPVPNSIAVLPWTYFGSNPELKPLERGMAHLVVTDLAKVSRLTLLERERVQALSDELALSAAGRVDPATAARSGRLLRAAEVLQGSIRETGADAIRLDADVVNTTTADIRASGSASDRLEQLLAMEKSLVLDLLGRLGLALTPAEQRAIAERPTADLQAFLAFSRGLEAEDRGNFSEAARLFQQAATQDPGFGAARDRAATTARIGAASRMTPARLAQELRLSAVGARSQGMAGLRGTQLAAAVQAVAPTLAGRLGQRPGKLAAVRARLAEALRQDDPSRLGTITKTVVTIPRP